MVFLILLFTFLTKKKLPGDDQQNNGQTIQPTIIQTEYKKPENLPIDIKSVPTLIPSEGKGLDLQSAPVVESVSEISKIKEKLPLVKTINSGNIQVGIVIPEQKYQDNDYTILVNLNGIDFQIPTDDIYYFENQDAFVAGASEVLNWLKENNVDIKKIIIKWGDKAYVNKRANIWLNYVKI